MTGNDLLTVTFRVSCKATIGGPVMRRMWSDLTSPPWVNDAASSLAGVPQQWPGHDAAEAFGRRLKAANACHGFDLDERRCVLSSTRITLVGSAGFTRGYSRAPLHAGDAVDSLVRLVRFTLYSVYGHKDQGIGDVAPLPGLSITVRDRS